MAIKTVMTLEIIEVKFARKVIKPSSALRCFNKEVISLENFFESQKPKKSMKTKSKILIANCVIASTKTSWFICNCLNSSFMYPLIRPKIKNKNDAS